jgi:hypothetical protein
VLFGNAEMDLTSRRLAERSSDSEEASGEFDLCATAGLVALLSRHSGGRLRCDDSDPSLNLLIH